MVKLLNHLKNILYQYLNINYLAINKIYALFVILNPHNPYQIIKKIGYDIILYLTYIVNKSSGLSFLHIQKFINVFYIYLIIFLK